MYRNLRALLALFTALPAGKSFIVLAPVRTAFPLRAVSPAIGETEGATDVPPFQPDVSLSTLQALDIRSGLVVKADLIADPDHGNNPSRRYLSLLVDLGSERRAVISSVRPIMDVEDAVGKKVLMIANTEEETVLGRPSRGRILTIENFSKEPMPRTLRTKLLAPGGMPPGSQASAV